MGLSEIGVIHKLYDILKIKNVLAKFLYWVIE
jgi:hypothetical protein